MRILIAYDGSPSSEAAVDEVVRRPWPANSEVLFVMAVERPLPAPAPDGAVYEPLVQRMQDSLREEASRKIRKALEKFRSRADLRTTSELMDGNAKHCLLDAIREWKADLVVTGSHGTGGLARLFLGSVSHALVTHAPCSVEVVKMPPATPEARK